MDKGTKTGTISGTLVTVFYNIRAEDLAKTAVLAALGALVSFFVSLLLKWIVKKIKEYNR